jgi:hypothetical protein
VNGCEATLDSVTDCGRCGHTCTNPNGSTACNAGTCVPSCAPGFASCDGDPDNGCEQPTDADVTNCGGCGIRCGVTPGYSYPDTTSYTCQGGVCAVATCTANHVNLDAPTNPNGCECLDQIPGSPSCAGAIAMGTVDDVAGQSVTATGNLPVGGKDAWYTFVAANSHWAAGSNPFNVKVGFSANPNDEFALYVYTDCGGNSVCPDAGSPIHLTRATDLWEYNTSGENPCVAGTPLAGKQQCIDHTWTYYIRVTRRSAPTCNSFTIQVTNGP